MIYNELEIVVNDIHYVFITRGKTKAFSAEEAVAYLAARSAKEPEELELTPFGFDEQVKVFAENNPPLPPTEESHWQLPDNKHSRAMFYADLRQGLEFTMGKYGVTEEQVRAEAARLSYQGLI